MHKDKTEVCLFHKNDPPKITIRLQNVSIQSKKEMNVLGVIFDCKLNWNTHIASAIVKARKALYALRQIRMYFSPEAMRLLLDSNFYSVLYYNAFVELGDGVGDVSFWCRDGAYIDLGYR